MDLYQGTFLSFIKSQIVTTTKLGNHKPIQPIIQITGMNVRIIKTHSPVA